MPEIEYTGMVEFGVYCAECGAGICSSSDFDSRRNNLTVSCPHCIKAYQDTIKSLEDEIRELQKQLDE